MREVDAVELARLKKNILTVLLLLSWVLTRCFLTPLGVLLVMKKLEDEQYVAIKAYKLTIFEIWRDFHVLPYIACPRYPYIRVNRLYDSYGMTTQPYMPALVSML